MRRYRLLEHTADIGVIAYGHSLNEAFANAAYGMFNVLSDLRNVRTVLCRDIEISATDREALLIEWLNELLFIFDVDNIIFKKFTITEMEETRLVAQACGEEVDPSRHRLRTAIKAATYHGLEIKEKDGVYVARVILDI